MAKHKKGTGSKNRRGSMDRCPACGRKVVWKMALHPRSGLERLLIHEEDGMRLHHCGRRK